MLKEASEDWIDCSPTNWNLGFRCFGLSRCKWKTAVVIWLLQIFILGLVNLRDIFDFFHCRSAKFCKMASFPTVVAFLPTGRAWLHPIFSEKMHLHNYDMFSLFSVVVVLRCHPLRNVHGNCSRGAFSLGNCLHVCLIVVFGGVVFYFRCFRVAALVHRWISRIFQTLVELSGREGLFS